MTSAIRVLIVDDHLIVREGLRMILADYPGVMLVGEAENGLQAIALAEETQPDVILMDLQMPELDGMAAIEKIKAQWPEIAVVILTTYNEEQLLIRGLQAGAQGFLLKDIDRQSLLDTIQAAHQGKILLAPEVLNRLLPKVETTTPSTTQPQLNGEGAPIRPVLSQRELDVLKLVAAGARYKEIAIQLNISESTVKAHLVSIYNKLGVDSRTAAVSMAFRRGFLDD